MPRLHLCGALAAALIGASLAACSTTSVQTAKVDGGKALAVAYDGLNAAGQLTQTAIANGLLTGANEQRAGQYLALARKTLDTADDGYKAGTATDPTTAIGQVAALVADISALAQGKETSTLASAAATAAKALGATPQVAQ